jgi:putative ABC transport system permease protein
MIYAWLWAIRHLIHRRDRTITAAAGIAFAVILMFLEMGFLEGVDRTATLLFDRLQFDLLLTSSEYEDLSRTAVFPDQRLAQALAVDGVASVIPLSMGFAEWRMPQRHSWLGHPSGGQIMSIAVLAIPPEYLPVVFQTGPDGVFSSTTEAQDAVHLLTRQDAFLFDRRSKAEYGTAEYWLEQSQRRDSQDPVLINGRSALITGTFSLGTGFSWNALLLTSDMTFREFLPQSPSGAHFGLIQLRADANASAVYQQLQACLPPDVRIWTREEITASERNYWVRLTSVGQFLLVAVVLVVVVGVIFVYQMMTADIRSMLPEYATMKAIGHSPGFTTTMVLGQASILALLGFFPGWGIAAFLYSVARTHGGIPAEMTPWIIASVAGLTVGMCLLSGVLALRRVHTADPADLF